MAVYENRRAVGATNNTRRIALVEPRWNPKDEA